MRRRLVMLGLALVASVVAAPSLVRADPLDASEVLADEAFGFCHDERYPLTEDEAQWCSLLPQEAPPCPAFRSACGAPRAAEGVGGPQWRREAGEQTAEESKRKERGPDERSRTREQESITVETSDTGLSSLAHIMVWVIVAVMLVALLAQFRGPGARARRDEPDDRDDTPAPAPDQPLAAPEPEETDVDRLLARAVSRAERGELEAAVSDGHAALVRRLAEHGHIRLHPSRTNGDHVRDLRGAPPLYEPTRQVMRLVDRVQFGHAALSRAEVDRLLAQVRSVLSSVAGVFLVLLLSLACTAHGPSEPHQYPWSHSPSGTAGVLQLLRSHDYEIEYRATTLDSDDGSTGRTPIVLDEAELSDEEWSVLLEHVRRGGHAVLATSEQLPSELDVEHGRRRPGPLWSPYSEEPGVRLSVPGDAGIRPSDTRAYEPLWVDEAGTPYALELDHGFGSILVLADDHLLTNAALAVPDDGAVLVELLRYRGQRFELIDGGLRAAAGAGATDPFDAVSRANLTPVVLQLLLLVALLYLWRGVHFGRPRDPPPPSRRRFVEHVEALAQHYQRAGARRHALRLYAGWALDRVQERFGGRRRGLHHLAHRIATRTGRDETEIMRILVEAHHARDDRDGEGTEDDLRTLRELGLLIETTPGPPTRTHEPRSLQ